MNELAMLALDKAKSLGASYADIRINLYKSQSIRTANDRKGREIVSSLQESEDYGFGVRVLYDGAWGFSSSNKVTKEEVERIASRAVQIGKESAKIKVNDVVLTPEPPHIDVWQTPIIKDPFLISVEQKIDFLHRINRELKKTRGIESANANMGFNLVDKIFASTEGSYIQQKLYRSGCGYTATAEKNGVRETRSNPDLPLGRGYEYLEERPLMEEAPRVAEEAVQKLDAVECEPGRKDLVLDPTHLLLTIHESVGHPTELDRSLGWEANYAGRSFCTTDKLNNMRYGSKAVNFVADNTLVNGLSTCGYDDEGVKAQRWHIIKDGMFTGFGTSREVAHFIGLKRGNGCGFASSWKYMPINRIPNLSLMPGTWELDDMIKDVKDGIYIEGRGNYSIDQLRYNFQFGGDMFREIKNGKLGRYLKNVLYGGITTEFWNACDAVCNEKFWKPYGTTGCAKGQPVQIHTMSHGSAHARFRNIKVGV
ncbi:TldD/PmbA family protein [candidate division KSB1 bacterium]